MEVGQTAIAPHYSQRWDGIGEREPFYSTESWKDNINSRKLSVGTSIHAWSDGIGIPTSASGSSPSLSSFLAPTVMDGSVDKVLYHNLVEMIPLVETFMDQQQINKSFPRHAPLIYTPTPQKVAEHPFKGKKGRGQLLQDNQVDQNSLSNAMVAQLQAQMEELEQKLQEKDAELQAAEIASKQADLLLLQTSMEELRKGILTKEREIQNAINQLSQTQLEVTSLQSLLEEAEAELEASNFNVAKVHEESQSLQCQVAAFVLWMESISSCLDDYQVVDEPERLPRSATPTMENEPADQTTSAQRYESDGEQIELTRRRYLACLIAARHNPSDELLVLLAQLRAQLEGYVLHPNAT